MGWVWLFAAGAGWLLMQRAKICRPLGRFLKVASALAVLPLSAAAAWAQAPEAGGEASLKLPDLSQVTFFGIDGHKLLLFGILFCIFGLIFGLTIYQRLKNLPVHRSMREISELIYETCKTYLITQGKFLLLLETFIAVVIVLYFGVLLHMDAFRVVIILLFSVLGIAGSYSVAWFGIRVNTFANSRTAFAGLGGKPYPIYKIPLDAGMSIGMMLISVELADDAVHSSLRSRRLRGLLLHRLCHRRIAGRRGAAHRRRHLHQNRRYRLRPDEDRLQASRKTTPAIPASSPTAPATMPAIRSAPARTASKLTASPASR